MLHRRWKWNCLDACKQNSNANKAGSVGSAKKNTRLVVGIDLGVVVLVVSALRARLQASFTSEDVLAATTPVLEHITENDIAERGFFFHVRFPVTITLKEVLTYSFTFAGNWRS